MATGWIKNTPSRKLPPDWPERVIAIKNRAFGQCEHTMQHNMQRCPERGRDVDHIVERSDGGTDRLDNLQLLCKYHHGQKTGQHAGQKSQARRRERERRNKRKHPGLMP